MKNVGQSQSPGVERELTTPDERVRPAPPGPGAGGPTDGCDGTSRGDRPREVAQAETQEHPAGTRRRVARSLLENGPSTAADLAERLELTPAAVRRHLDALLAEGVVEARERRGVGPRGRGRPARTFALTDAGRAGFHHSYDQLAVEALAFLAEHAGPEAVVEFARARFSPLEERLAEVLATVEPQLRTQAIAEVLSSEGYAASARTAPAVGQGGGEQLCQHHCPVAHVAERFPQLCEVETELFSRLLGTHVQRLATIAHGDGVCTTYVPAPSGRDPGPGGGSGGPEPRTPDRATDRGRAAPASESNPDSGRKTR